MEMVYRLLQSSSFGFSFSLLNCYCFLHWQHQLAHVQFILISVYFFEDEMRLFILLETYCSGSLVGHTLFSARNVVYINIRCEFTLFSLVIVKILEFYRVSVRQMVQPVLSSIQLFSRSSTVFITILNLLWYSFLYYFLQHCISSVLLCSARSALFCSSLLIRRFY